MNELEKVLKDVVYGSVGAVTTVLEVGSELAKSFVEKGQEAVRQGQERAEEVKKAMKDACDSLMNDPGIDVSTLNRAQRDELRRRLDEMDAAEEAAAQCECSESEETCSYEEGCDCASAEEQKPEAAVQEVEPVDIGVTYETSDEDEH